MAAVTVETQKHRPHRPPCCPRVRRRAPRPPRRPRDSCSWLHLEDRPEASAAVRDPATTAAAVADLRRASKDDSEIRAPLADAGAVPFLAAQLTAPSTSTSAEDAVAALLNISISAREQLMSTPGILDALAAALQAEEYSAAHHVVATVHSLLCMDAYRPIIGAKQP